MCFILFGMPFTASAEETANFKDTQTSVTMPGSIIAMTGPHIAYFAVLNKVTQVFYRNLTTGEVKQITDSPNSKDSLNIGLSSDGQAVVVWTEYQNAKNSDYNHIWDVYSYNLTTSLTKKHNGTDANYTKLQIEGDYLVYFNNFKGSFYVYNLKENKETFIENGAFPLLSNGKIVFTTRDDSHVSRNINSYDPKTGVTELLHTLAKDENIGFSNLFNGKFYLYVADQFSSFSSPKPHKYMLLNVETKQVYNLTDWQTGNVYAYMTMGNQYAAFITGMDGKDQFNWVDLSTGSIQEMSNPADSYRYFRFQGDQLVMVNKSDLKFFYRTVNGTEDRFASILPKPSPAVKPVTVQTTVGANGGRLMVPGGKAILVIGKGVLKQNAKVGLTSSSVTDSKTTIISTAWTVSSDKKWTKNATLTLSYDPSLSAGKNPVMAHYDPKAAVWKPISGKVDAKKKTVIASISTTGTYAIIVK